MKMNEIQLVSMPGATQTSLTCTTSSGSGSGLVVRVNGVDFPSGTFEYGTSGTASVTSVSPTDPGFAGDTLTLAYTGGASYPATKVFIGEVEAAISSQSAGSVVVTVPEKASGVSGNDLSVVMLTEWGYSDSAATFTYGVSLSSVSPTEGSLGGGFTLTLTGKGLDSEVPALPAEEPTERTSSGGTGVTVCGLPCPVNPSQTSTELTCTVPSVDTAGACDVVMSQGGVNVTLASGQVKATFFVTPKSAIVPRDMPVSSGWSG